MTRSADCERRALAAVCNRRLLTKKGKAVGLYDRDYMVDHWWEQTFGEPRKKARPPLGPVYVAALHRRTRRKRPPEIALSLWAVIFLAVLTIFAALLSLAGYDFVGLIRWVLEPVGALLG